MSSIPVFDISNPLGGLVDQAVAMGYVNEKRTTTKGAIASFDDNIEHAVSLEVDIDPTLDGVSEVNVVRTGKNLAEIFRDGKVPSITDGSLVTASGSRTDFIKVNPSTTYTMSCDTLMALYAFYYSDKNTSSFISTSNDTGTSLTFTTPNNCNYVMLRYNSNSVSEGQLETGSTATAYEPYSATTRTIPLGSTVHGGSLSVSEEGAVELTTTYAAYSFTGSEVWALDTDETYFETELSLGTAVFTDDSAYMTSNGILLRLQDDGKTIRAYLADNESLTAESDMNEIFTNTDKLVYELAILLSTDLTDIDPIETLVGENNIWADTGDIEVGYYYQLYQPI